MRVKSSYIVLLGGKMTSNKPIPCARALHGFEGQGTHELSFSAGVSILLLRRIDENWLEGKLEDKVGIFPASYVKIQLGSPSGKRSNNSSAKKKINFHVGCFS